MAMYKVEINEDTEAVAEAITKGVLKQIKKDTADGGIMEACDIILTYLDPVAMKDFKDSGFTDDFGVHME